MMGVLDTDLTGKNEQGRRHCNPGSICLAGKGPGKLLMSLREFIHEYLPRVNLRSSWMWFMSLGEESNKISKNMSSESELSHHLADT